MTRKSLLLRNKDWGSIPDTNSLTFKEQGSFYSNFYFKQIIARIEISICTTQPPPFKNNSSSSSENPHNFYTTQFTSQNLQYATQIRHTSNDINTQVPGPINASESAPRINITWSTCTNHATLLKVHNTLQKHPYGVRSLVKSGHY